MNLISEDIAMSRVVNNEIIPICTCTHWACRSGWMGHEGAVNMYNRTAARIRGINAIRPGGIADPRLIKITDVKNREEVDIGCYTGRTDYRIGVDHYFKRTFGKFWAGAEGITEGEGGIEA